MVSIIERAICNRYLCYLPVVFFTLLISIELIQLAPTRCLLWVSSQDCFFSQFEMSSIYHPLNIINLVFLAYSILYIYYNIFLNQNIVGQMVKNVYRKTKKRYPLKSKRQQISILLLCYSIALIVSYFRFTIILAKAIY